MTTLSANTLRSYESAIKKIKGGLGESYTATAAVVWLETEVPNPNSRRVYLSACLFYAKGGVASEYDIYRAAFDKTRVLANQHTKKQELPEARKEKYVPWDEVVRLYNEQKHLLDPQAKVLAACYVLNPPVRADFAGMMYVKRMPKTIEGNYCLLRKSKPVFLFSTYKTANAYGLQELPINKDLYTILAQHHASGATLVYDGNANALSHYIRNLFKTITGKEMGIGLLRHSFITKFYESNPSIAEKEAVANRMLHSYTTGEMYREVGEENT